MTEIERLKSIFYNEENCLKFLLVNNQIEKCNSCGKDEFYQGSDFMKSFIKVCKSCKMKIEIKSKKEYHEMMVEIYKLMNKGQGKSAKKKLKATAPARYVMDPSMIPTI
jgi:hypothetical protein